EVMKRDAGDTAWVCGTTSGVGPGDIDTAKIAADAVDTDKIRSDSVIRAKIAALAVDSSKLAAGSVDSEKIAPNAVNVEDIADGAVTGAKLAALTIDSSKLAANSVDSEKVVNNALVPAGMVSFFALASCPTGWTEYTTGRGRYVVGLPGGGALEGTNGTALSNLEDRPVGQHNHGVTDPGHTHNILNSAATNQSGGMSAKGNTTSSTPGTESNTTGVTINNAGSVAGTNAPYVQLLACKKN
ncbi:MAG: hypothetical protein HY554_10485, partial [Elusimicrobia bacterium]|nr:hypothetical protein [Elusimicrobiota bacterium]